MIYTDGDFVQNIYTAFASIVNDEKIQNNFYKGNRDLLFYACNESENRGKIDRNDITGFHGVFCVTNVRDDNDYFKDELLPCGGVKESVCTVSNVLVTVNIYSDFDECLQTLEAMKKIFKLSAVKDRLGRANIAIVKTSGVKRLDTQIKERYEYRAMFDFEVQTKTADVSMEVETFDTLGVNIQHCNSLEIVETFSRLDRDCKK